MDWLGLLHLTLALAAIGAGAAVALARKGTRRHRYLGRAYALSMLGVVVTAFLIYDLFGGFGPFHFAAVVSLITVVMGWIPARRRRPRAWMEHHAYWMSWSYVGLLAAAAAEVLSRIPDTPFWGMVLAASGAVVALGAVVIRRRVPSILAGLWRGPVTTRPPAEH